MPQTTPRLIRFDSPLQARVKPQRVYFKTRWQNEWELVSPNAWCNGATWNAAPSTATAEIEWRYGIALAPGARQFVARLRNAGKIRTLVKIEYDTFGLGVDNPSPLQWVGSIEIEMDNFQGAVTRSFGATPASYGSGKLFYHAVGLESLLANASVLGSWIADGSQGKVFVGRALTFNHSGVGNRSRDTGPDGVYLFHDRPTGGETWSTDDIVRYLLKYQTPKDNWGNVTVPITLNSFLATVPIWDVPVVTQENKTLQELLNVLLPRQRLLSWTLRYKPAPFAGDTLEVAAFSLAGDDIFAPTDPPHFGPVVAANPNQFRLVVEHDRGLSLAIKRVGSDIADQVVMRGARRTSTASFGFGESSLTSGWPSALELEFEAGASGATDYPPASEVGARMERNRQARAADRFSAVYARFVLPPDFDGFVGNGVGLIATEPLMPRDDDASLSAPLAPEDLRFAPMVLLEGLDYATVPVPVDRSQPTPHKRKPLVLYPRSDSDVDHDRYRQVDTIGLAAELPENIELGDVWSASVQLAEDGALLVHVQSAPQEIIASQDFSRLDCDIDLADFGKVNFRLLTVTACVQWSAFAEGHYPPSIAGTTDITRIMILLAGDDYRCDYLVPDTIIGLQSGSAELIRSEGGFIRDDREQLTALAKVAFEWYQEIRQSLSFTSHLLNDRLQVGDYIVALGDPAAAGDIARQDINSVVTQIEVKSPSSESEGSPHVSLPSISYETAFGELDPLALL